MKPMLKPSPVAIIVTVVVAVVALIGWRLADRVYMKPRAELLVEMDEHRGRIAAYEQQLTKHFAVRDELRELGQASIGRDRDRVEHAIRSSVVALSAGTGLRDAVVNTGRPNSVVNPAASERINTGLRRALRSRSDLQTISGRLSGTGSFDVVLGTLASMHSQPWLDRIDGFTLLPKGRDRVEFDLAVDFTVLLLPDLAPVDPAPIVVMPASESSLASIAGVLSRQPFADPLPPPEVKPAPEPEPEPEPIAKPAPPPPPPPPPYGDWSLTAVVLREDASQSEAWLRNSKENRVVILVPGDELLGVRLIGVSPEHAEWEHEGRPGKTLLRQTLERAVKPRG